MSSPDHAGASPVIIPNKVSFKSTSITVPVWPEEVLKYISNSFDEQTSNNQVFDKLDNPFLNGLKQCSPSHQIFCPKCNKLEKLTKHGKVKETFQFECAAGGHKISATQILETVSDEFIVEQVSKVTEPYKSLILEWIGKEHLSPELWDVRKSRNATKRFAVNLSPMKPVEFTKIPAINNSLESENEV